MVKEVISSILKAEEEADRIVKEATAANKKAIADAEEEAYALKQSEIANFKKLSKEEIAKANAFAEEAYAKKIEEGKLEAEKLYNSAAENMDKGVSLILKRLNA